MNDAGTGGSAVGSPALLRQAQACIDAATAAEHTGLMHLKVLRHRQLALALGFERAGAVAEAVAERLREILRPDDRVAGCGGWEFVVLLPRLLGVGHATLAAQRVLRAFERPLVVDAQPVTVSVAVGVAVAPAHAQTGTDLARRALGALDRALRFGERIVLGESAPAQVPPLDDLREALRTNALSIAFQPIVRLSDRRIVAAEALARWQHPVRGSIAPSVFVALAEQAGLAVELTRFSLHAALREYVGLARAHPGLVCSLNLSTRAFDDSGLAELVLGALSIWNVAPERLVLEVTETALLEDAAQCAQALQALRSAGVGIALDDFGKGYSSFNYLRHFPASALKVDGGFVLAMESDPRAARLLASMVGLAHNLDLRVIAEGVETAALAGKVAELGCDLAQGWHFGRPRPAAEFGR